MNAIDYIKVAQQATLTSEDGERIALELLPPVTPAEIDSLEKQVGLPLPGELRELLTFCSGIHGCLEEIDFTGASMAFGAEEIFPHGLPIASDGFGNFWVLDITPITSEAAPVFFACHDAPVILFQSPGIAPFLEDVFRLYTPPHKSAVDDVHDDRLFNVWRNNPGVISHSEAAASSDPDVRAFASTLPEHFQFIDMRRPNPGMGFSWGRYGPRTEVRRHGHERIFAYAKPAGRGLLGKLFGR